MKHIKTFKMFESGSLSPLTPKMKDLANSMMCSIGLCVETNREQMDKWVFQEALQRVMDEYVESDEFKKFTRGKAAESPEYESSVRNGEDPEKALNLLTDRFFRNQEYWDEFLEETHYESDAVNDIYYEIKYLPAKGKDNTYFDLDSVWKEVKGSSSPFPTIEIKGNALLNEKNCTYSFLPFRVGKVEFSDLPTDYNYNFQTAYEEENSGELIIHNTRLIALDKGPIDVESTLYITDNSRLLSLEGIDEYGGIEIDDNFLDSEILKRSISLSPGSEESFEYYLSLLQIPQFSSFDEEQIEFIFKRIGKGGIQDAINDNPEKMAILLKSSWKKIKEIPKYKDLKFPENLSSEIDFLSDLSDIGL